MKAPILVIFSLLLCSNSLQAQIYKWTDEDGKVHFGERPPNKKANTERVKTKVNSYTPDPLQSNTKLKIYTTSWCGFCKKAKEYFKKNNIAFTEYNIEKDKFAKLEYERIQGRGVPVILLGKQRMNGFSVSRFKQFYKEAIIRPKAKQAS